MMVQFIHVQRRLDMQVLCGGCKINLKFFSQWRDWDIINTECWHGHVKGWFKYALGYSSKKVVAGFCEEHKDYEIEAEV